MCGEIIEMASKLLLLIGFLHDENRNLDESIDRCNEQITEYKEFTKESKSRLHAMQVRIRIRIG